MSLEIGLCTCGNCRFCGYRPGFAPAVLQPVHVIDYGQYNAHHWPAVPLVPGAYRFTPDPGLSDADVERIARRLAALPDDRDKARVGPVRR